MYFRIRNYCPGQLKIPSILPNLGARGANPISFPVRDCSAMTAFLRLFCGNLHIHKGYEYYTLKNHPVLVDFYRVISIKSLIRWLIV